MLSWLPDASRLYKDVPKDDVDNESDEARRSLGLAVDDNEVRKINTRECIIKE